MTLGNLWSGFIVIAEFNLERNLLNLVVIAKVVLNVQYALANI